jgi:multiple sugar transport system substrate-binding protein
MLVKNSQNPEAVAAYLKCERVAAAEEKYRQLEKESLSVKEKDAYGKWIPYVTVEQYDAVQSYLNEAKKNPLLILAMVWAKKCTAAEILPMSQEEL